MEEILSSSSSDSLPQNERERKFRILAFVLALNLTLGIASSLLGPLYPAEATKKGLTASVYGTVIGVSSLSIFSCIPLISICLIRGRVGSWKFEIRDCLLFIFFTDGLVLVLFGFLDLVDSTSVFSVLSFLLRLLDGVGSAGVIALPVSLCLTFPERKALVVGLQETVYYCGLTIGPLLGEALFQLGGFRAPFLLIGLFELGLSTLGYFWLPSIQNPSDTQESISQVVSRLMKLFLVPSFSLFVLLIILTGCGWGFLTATLSADLEQFELSPLKTGLMFSLAGVPLLLTPIWGFLVDWTGRSKVVTFIGSLSALLGAALVGPLSFIPLKPSLGSTAIGLLLVGIGEGALLGSNFYNLVIGTRKLNSSSDSVATVIGVSCFYALSTNLGLFVGPTVGGILLEHVGFRAGTLFQCSAYMLICMTVSTFSLYLANNGGMNSREAYSDEEHETAESSDEVRPLLKDSSKSGL